MLVHQLGGAEPVDRAVEVFRHPFREIRQFHSSAERVYGKAVLRQRVVSVPDEVILRFLERRFDPLFLVLQDGLISGNDRLEYRLSHLRFQSKFCTQRRIQSLVERKLF